MSTFESPAWEGAAEEKLQGMAMDAETQDDTARTALRHGFSGH